MYVDVGFGNFVEENKIITISRPDSAPTKRLINQAKDDGRYIDLTQGKKTRSVILSSDQKGTILIGSAVQPNTIIARLKKERSKSEEIIITGVASPIELIGEGSSE